MTSILKVDTIQDTAGNNIINESSDTITIGASGDTVNIVGTLQNNGSGLASGITMADQWRVTADITTDTNPISANLERVDTAGQGTLGTGMTESSGIFSFPSTGIYLVRFSSSAYTGTTDNFGFRIYVTTNNSTYTEIAVGFGGHDSSNDLNVITETLVDVTDVANVKVKFEVYSITAGGGTHGSTTSNKTYFTFIRLGDT